MPDKRLYSRLAPVLFAALMIGSMLTGCQLIDSMFEKEAAPVAAPAPTPVPTPVMPSPSEYVSAEEYFAGAVTAEKIPAALEAATEQLRAAAVQDLLNDQWARGEFPKGGPCFIAVGANDTTLQDPSDALLAAVKSEELTLKKYSQCVADEKSVRDSASGAEGVLIKVVRIAWTGPESAVLHYGYNTGGIHGRMTQAMAERIGGAWTFTPRKVAIY